MDTITVSIVNYIKVKFCAGSSCFVGVNTGQLRLKNNYKSIIVNLVQSGWICHSNQIRKIV